MVLASQFNSFVHPLTIMTAVPLSLPAGLLALMAFGMTINVYSAIGLMMLLGIVKKNSILQVDYTNTLRAEGLNRHDAIVQGQPRAAPADSHDDDCDRRRDAPDRLRPRRRIGLARLDGRHDHRRADSLPPADAPHHAGRVFLFRRPESVAAERFDEPFRKLLRPAGIAAPEKAEL
jgi:AcrB/AcrD/AcrF family protein